MAAWFQDQCPVEFDQRLWIERRCNWLLAVFGEERLRIGPDVIPTPEYFPDGLPRNQRQVKELLPRLCALMGVNSESLELRFVARDDAKNITPIHKHSVSLVCRHGCYHSHPSDPRRALIRIYTDDIKDQRKLISSLIHQLSHHLLQVYGVLRRTWDLEKLTELLPCLLGLGVFAANDCTQRAAESPDLGLRPRGPLSLEGHAYALALRMRLRTNRRTNPRPFFKGSLRPLFDDAQSYLERNGECLFPGPTGRPVGMNRSLFDIHRELCSPDPSLRVCAAEDIHLMASVVPETLAAIAQSLDSGYRDVETLLAETVVKYAPFVGPWQSRMICFLDSSVPSIQCLALKAMGRYQPELFLISPSGRSVEDHLFEHLLSPERSVAVAASFAISCYGIKLRGMIPRFKAELLRACSQRELERVEFLWTLVLALSGRAKQALVDLNMGAQEHILVMNSLTAIRMNTDTGY